MSNILKLLEKYTAIAAVSGDENALAEEIVRDISPFVDSCERLPLGGICGMKKGKSRSSERLMLDAHMDEVGFIVTAITDEGFLRFDSVGGIDNRSVFGKRVRIGEVTGVIGGCAVHLLKADARDAVPETDDMFIDIGAADKADAEKYIKIGDRAIFDTQLSISDNSLVGRALDDRVGCAVLADMIMNDSDFDFYFSFSVLEEVGCRGAATAAFHIEPTSAIVLEATTAADIGDTSADKQVCACGAGAVVSFMDGGTVYDKKYYDFALKVGAEIGIAVQPKRKVAGGNNSASIHKSIGGVRTLALSLPCRYIHSGTGKADASDVEQLAKLAALMRDSICGGKCR